VPCQNMFGFELCNVLGQVVKTQSSFYDAGIHDVHIPVNNVPAGVYFLRVQELPQNTTVKVIIAR